MTAILSILKIYFMLLNKKEIWLNLLGSMETTCRSKIVKIVPIVTSKMAVILEIYFALLNQKATRLENW